MSLPTDRRDREAADEALIAAATRVVTADNRTRWATSWVAACHTAA
jgi:hypothetical protein